MALQSKTFTWGSYAYKSESNSYVLELTLTENSTSTANNTSSVTYALVLKSGSNNQFTGQIDSTLTLGGVEVDAGQKQITKAYNQTWTLLSGNATVSHNADGKLNMPIKVTIKTYNSYAPPDKTLTWSWALTDIPRASAITAAADTVLGDPCSITWTPNSPDYWYWLWFSLGNWNSGWIPTLKQGIHPGSTGKYTYTGYELPMEVAEQIPGSTGSMLARLYTYPNSEGKSEDQIGDCAEMEFTVTVPENEATKPSVSIVELTPDVTPIAGLYIQGLSKVKASVQGTGKYGASITGYTMQVDGRIYSDALQSDYLTTDGELTVTVTATDSRGFPGSATGKITVLPYSKPKLINVAAYRCRSDGKRADDGEYLRIEATREYAKLISDGVQQNACGLWWRYREESQAFGDYIPLLAEDAQEDTVTTEPLLNATLSKDTAYTVEIFARDNTGQTASVTVAIPSERVYMHKPAMGKGMGLGGYCTEDWLLDVYWNTRIRGDLRLGENETLMDFVVEQGTLEAQTSTEGVSILWSYRKWHSGIAECWGLYPIAGADISKAWGSLFETEASYSADFPAGLFADVPAVEYTVQRASPYAVLCLQALGGSTKETTCQIFPVRATAATVDLTVSIMARGKWNNTKEE